MAGRYARQAPDGSGRVVIAMTLLALLLVAVVPVALLVAVIMIALGDVAVGFAVLGGSVVGAAVALTFAGMSGKRHLRKLLSASNFRGGWLNTDQDASEPGPDSSDDPSVVRLDPSEYTEVR